jgi:protein-L-isoaspartate(D-aspartate) O-methyltransferase
MKLFQSKPLSSVDAATESVRHQMVQEQIVRRGVTDPRVLEAMRLIPRHRFVPEAHGSGAYLDAPQPILCGQTISQPYIVASMTEYLELHPESKVLEIGTGSGYQTAVLAELAAHVYTVEFQPELHRGAQTLLGLLGYDNIQFRLADGALGWPEVAPFDAIIVTAAASHVPPALLEQLAIGGRLIIPVRQDTAGNQSLMLVRKDSVGLQTELLYPVRFVPLLSPESGTH